MSDLARTVRASLRQQCTIEPFDPTQGVDGYDEHGQPIYGAPRVAACRSTTKLVRSQDARGDEHTIIGTVLILAADDPVTDRDRITLDQGRGPVIAQVTTYVDLGGRVTHKEVSI